MKANRNSFSAAVVVAWVGLVLAASPVSGQGAGRGNANNPPPEAGLTIEPVQRNQAPAAEFTNETGADLAIIYGQEKFTLRPGASKSVPVPNQPMFDLRVFEKPANGALRERYQNRVTPKDPKRFIPFSWAEPHKKAR